MRILHASDWHTDYYGAVTQMNRVLKQEYFRNNEDVQPDLVILTGDMIWNFNPRNPAFEEARQVQHYEQMIDYIDRCYPGVDIFAIRGNHDWFNYGIDGSVKSFDNIEGQGFEYLGLKFYGFRGVPALYGAWNDEYSEKKLEMLCQSVPLDTNVLVTHAPPHGILDDVRDVERTRKMPGLSPDFTLEPRHIGSVAIRELVDRLPNLKLHVFGHCHEQGCRVQTRNGVIFSNAAEGANMIHLGL